MEESKVIWTSRTFWVNAVALLVSLAAGFGLDLGLSEAEQASLATSILAVVNIVLRFLTNSPVTLK